MVVVSEEMNIPRIVIGGVASGVGKTTVAAGLIMALRRAGLTTQAFKVGPDYIDTSYHSELSGRVATNLDTWLTDEEKVKEIFAWRCRGADIAVIEGVMGLYDGSEVASASSTAEIAKLLRAPVLLVIDAGRIAQSIAALVIGFREFDQEVDLAGVILNRVGSARHLRILENALNNEGAEVYGALKRSDKIHFGERHLGLSSVNESRDRIGADWDPLATAIEEGVSVDRVIETAKGAKPISAPLSFFSAGADRAEEPVAIGVARDEAFSFYYEENLEMLEAYGAKLKYFSPCSDASLPPVSALYLGGGFPELRAAELAGNEGMRLSIKTAIEAGLPVYAECGGLIYLTEEVLDQRGERWPMVGAIPARAKMGSGLRHFGYVTAVVAEDSLLAVEGLALRGHEFHWSEIEYETTARHAYRVKHSDRRGRLEGYVYENILASFVHTHFCQDLRLAERFVAKARVWARDQAETAVAR